MVIPRGYISALPLWKPCAGDSIRSLSPAWTRLDFVSALCVNMAAYAIGYWLAMHVPMTTHSPELLLLFLAL